MPQSQETTEPHDGVRHAPRDLVDHQVIDLSDLGAFHIVDVGALHILARYELMVGMGCGAGHDNLLIFRECARSYGERSLSLASENARTKPKFRRKKGRRFPIRPAMPRRSVPRRSTPQWGDGGR